MRRIFKTQLKFDSMCWNTSIDQFNANQKDYGMIFCWSKNIKFSSSRRFEIDSQCFIIRIDLDEENV